MRAQRGQVVLEEVKLWCMQNLGVLLAQANEVLELLDFIGAKAHQWRMVVLRQRLFFRASCRAERKTKSEFLESTLSHTTRSSLTKGHEGAFFNCI